MRSFSLIIFCFLALLGACSKNSYQFEIDDPEKRYPVADGFITDLIEKQNFTLTWTQPIGTQNPTHINDATFKLITPDGPESFIETTPGKYESVNAFKGEYGANYTIEFAHEGISHSADFKMPQPVIIHDFIFQDFASDSTYDVEPARVQFYCDSPVKQYLRFKLFTAAFYTDTDTLWIDHHIPIYRLIEANAGDNVLITLPIDPTTNIFVGYNHLIRIELEVMTAEVAEYILTLKNYSTEATSENTSLNPPFYYTNEAYGIGYGTIKFTEIHLY